MIADIIFFVLTWFAVLALVALCRLLGLPQGWTPLILCLVTAEILLRRGRKTGVEAALWIGGLIAFIFSLPHNGRPEAILVFAAAFVLAGWRLRNSLFGTVAVVLGIAYLAQKHWRFEAMLMGVVIGIIAALVMTAVKRDSLFALVAIVSPIAGYVAYHSLREPSRAGVVILFAAAAAIDLAIGVYCRIRAPLIAGAVCVAIAAIEVQDFIALPLEARLILAGALMLATAAAIMRALRHRTTGIVVTPSKPHELQQIVQLAVTLQSTPTQPAEPASLEPGGGGFGGAGASGQY